MPLHGRHQKQDVTIKIGSGGWDGRFTVEKPILKEGYILARDFNRNEAEKLAHPTASHQQASAPPKSVSAPVPSVASNDGNRREINHPIGRPAEDDDEVDAIETTSSNSQPKIHQVTAAAAADQLDSNASDFHARRSHTEVLPTRWDGTFAPGAPYRPKPSPYTNTNNFYGFDTTPTVLPAQWDGKFQPAAPGNTYQVPKNQESMTNDFYGYNTEPTVLPTVWSGKFQLDPNDVRVKPERNGSDVRDYADHRNFRQVK